MKKLLLICVVFIAFIASAFSQTADTVYKPVEYPAGFTAQLNVVYTRVKDWEGKMDIYLPPKDKGPSPVVINIHGGGWNKGVKESQTGFSTFFKKGFAVANIEYRLTGQATAPAAVEDTRCALIYLIKNAAALNIDVNRIVIMGGSAGGHLALMGGLLGNDYRFDGNCPGVQNIKVAAIIDKYGITDVWDWGYGKNLTSKSATRWLGDKANDKEFAMSVSPVNYVTKNSPPIFIVHGNADPTVPYQQSVELYKKLQELGVQSEFITVEGGLHGKFEKEKNSEINNAMIRFIFSLPAFKK
ncbi:MAG TPA: alpha/beta hydrolase [Chitinophagaceae bacterium]|nr:alpha/beta hydrolase [Chitinophagaceae bacterium]HQV86091.1 alpha/beta hydrolase [Chitinophagaceae bacterium]HQX72666.1 alpha/beta hydrolase [Chitinophagaceae bacterium]HQZ74770.1 alpha/beta hydrolase [Chitinophagaceae bacterium]